MAAESVWDVNLAILILAQTKHTPRAWMYCAIKSWIKRMETRQQHIEEEERGAARMESHRRQASFD
jgi:hypothetical protein